MWQQDPALQEKRTLGFFVLSSFELNPPEVPPWFQRSQNPPDPQDVNLGTLETNPWNQSLKPLLSLGPAQPPFLEYSAQFGILTKPKLIFAFRMCLSVPGCHQMREAKDPGAWECLLWELSGSQLSLDWIKKQKIFTVVAPHTGDPFLTYSSHSRTSSWMCQPLLGLLSLHSSPCCTVNNLETSGVMSKAQTQAAQCTKSLPPPPKKKPQQL